MRDTLKHIKKAQPNLSYRICFIIALAFTLMLAGVQEAQAAAPDFYQLDSMSLQYPRFVQIVDVNSDGYDDLLTINWGTLDESVLPRLSVFLSKGNGTFESTVDYCLGNSSTTPRQFTVEDLDGDGNLDVAVTVSKNNSDDKIMVLLGNEDGTFQNPLEYAVGDSPTDIVAADFNRDGVLDLAVGQYQTNTLAVLLGTTGSFGFSAATFYHTGDYSESIAAGDFNQDTCLDLAVSNHAAGNISVLLNDGSGAFGAPANYGVENNTEVICADFNTDNDSDLLVCGRHGVYVFTGNGDGTLAEAVSYGSGENRYERSFVAGDFNGDGKLDLAALNNKSLSSVGFPELSVWEGNGDGAFQMEGTWNLAGEENSFSPGQLAAGDFNNDGKPDLAIVHSLVAMQQVSIMINNTGGALYTVTYDGNEHTGGTVPADSGVYNEGATVTVFGNALNLEKSGYKFAGWNTQADGNGTTYAAGDTFSIGAENVTLYAKWTPAYTVTYNGNENTGGTVPTDSTLYEAGATVTVLDNALNLEKSGYKFAGWNTQADGNGTTYAAGDMFSIGAENVTLYAKWTPAYTVTYNGNENTGGDVPTDSTLYEEGATVTVLDNTGNLVKTSYNFEGWNTRADGNGTDYTAGDIFSMATENVSLYAQWVEKPTYTVTFTGWNDEIWKTETVYEGSSATAPAVTDEPGYEFYEWDTGFSNITGDLTVKARYWCKCKLISIVNGGEIVEATNDILNENPAPLFLDAPEKEAYAYSGAYSDSTCTTPFDLNNPITDPTNMYLKFVEKFAEPAVYLAESPLASGVVSGGGIYVENDTVTVNAVPKYGFHFRNWSEGKSLWGGGGAFVSSDETYTFTMGMENRVLVANFEASSSYTVTYDGNGSTGGTVPTDQNSYEAGNTVTVSDNTGSLEKTGHSFGGWNTQADGGGTTYAAGDTFSMGSANVTLYAKWIEDQASTCTVTFNKNGGDTEASPATKTAESGGNIGTLPDAPTRAGYAFAGWNTAQDGSGDIFTAVTAVTSDMTVYAQWTSNPPTDSEKVAADKAALEIGFAPGDSASAVTQNLNLMVTGAVYGSTITWSSNNTVISNTGAVTRPAYESGDVNVTVTALVYNNGASDTKDFDLTVLKLAPITHTVTFKDWNSTVLKTQTVNDGAAAIAPGSPIRTGYTFTGWDKAFNNISSNLTVNALYSSNSSGDSGNTTPATPTYNVDINTGTGSDSTLPVTVDKNSGSADVDLGSGNSLMSDGKTTVITVPSIPDIDTYTLGISASSLSTPGEQGSVAFKTDLGSVTVPSNMLTDVAGISGDKAEISIGQGDKTILPEDVKAAIGDRPLVQLILSIDGKQTNWSNPNTPVTVNIPYTPTAEELANPESIVIWYIDGSGNVVTIPNGHYDPATGMVTVNVTHFSDYAVVYNKVRFNDVAAGAWYNKAVNFIGARGITSGTGNGKYIPEAALTRGECIVLLMIAYGIAPDTDPANNFSDAGNTFYTGYLAAAKRLGISSSVGNNMYAPGNEITRQEMFTLLYNVLKGIDQLPQGDSGKSLSSFSDAGQIALWAKDAMTLLVETGTIDGNNGKLFPTSTTTRAEIAQVVYNLLSK